MKEEAGGWMWHRVTTSKNGWYASTRNHALPSSCLDAVRVLLQNLPHICLRESSASCVPIRTSAIAMAMIQPAPKKDDDRDDDCKPPPCTQKMSQIRAKSSWICSLKAPKMWCPSFESVFVFVQPSIRHSLALRREPCCRKLACLMIRTWMLAVAHRSGLRDPLGFSCNVV